MGRRNIITGLVSVLILIISACGTARRGETVMEPYAIADPLALEGQQLYYRYCSKCHPNGAAGLAPSLFDKPLPGFFIRFQVRHGLGVMPEFKKDVIAPDQLDAIVEYIQAMKNISDQRVELIETH